MYWANVVIVMLTLLSADIATASVDHHSGTIRGLDTSAAYKFAFAFMQFLGTCGCLIGIRAFAAQFMILFIIQTYAFTLTLRRKNLVTHNQTLFFYVCQLTLGTTISFLEVHRAGGFDALFMFCALSTFAFFLRAGLGLSKYLMWGIMAIICQGARAQTAIHHRYPESRASWWPDWGWPAATAASATLLIAALAPKVQKKAEERRRAQAEAATTKVE